MSQKNKKGEGRGGEGSDRLVHALSQTDKLKDWQTDRETQAQHIVKWAYF